MITVYHLRNSRSERILWLLEELELDYAIETFDRGIAAARPAAELMAEALGWDEEQLAAEVDHYLRRVEAERQSQLMPTDHEADEARVKAPDIV